MQVAVGVVIHAGEAEVGVHQGNAVRIGTDVLADTAIRIIRVTRADGLVGIGHLPDAAQVVALVKKAPGSRRAGGRVLYIHPLRVIRLDADRRAKRLAALKQCSSVPDETAGFKNGAKIVFFHDAHAPAKTVIAELGAGIVGDIVDAYQAILSIPAVGRGGATNSVVLRAIAIVIELREFSRVSGDRQAVIGGAPSRLNFKGVIVAAAAARGDRGVQNHAAGRRGPAGIGAELGRLSGLGIDADSGGGGGSAEPGLNV